MCGRYTLTQPEKLKFRFDTENDIKDFDKCYNIAPSQYLPTITKNSPNTITMMRWSFIPSWSKNRKISLINILSETLQEKSYFRNILSKNRCLIPSDGFFEWKRVELEGKEEKIPYYIHIKENKLFSFAGVYNKLKDAEGKEILTFAILTTKPNSLVRKIHNRMPVILNKNDENTWLSQNSSENKLFELLKAFPSEKMESYKISMKVNNPQNNFPSILNKA